MRSSVLLLALGSIAAAGCPFPFPSDEETDAGPGDSGQPPPPPLTEPIAAGPAARALGIAEYSAEVGLDVPLAVTLRDFTGRRMGYFELGVDESGAGTASIVGRDGRSLLARYTPTSERAQPDSPGTLRMTLTSGAAELTAITWIDGTEPDAWAREQEYWAPLAAGAAPPSLGGMRTTSEGVFAVLTTLEGGVVQVSDDQVAAWLVQVGAGPLVEDPLVAVLLAIQTDEALVAAVHAELDRLMVEAGGLVGDLAAAGSRTDAIHTGFPCRELIGFLVGGSGIACGACLGAVLAAPAGGVTGLAIPVTCAVCIAGSGVSIVDGLACAVAYARRTTQDYCSNQFVCARGYEEARVAYDEHSCYCACDNDRCLAWCAAESARTGIPVAAGSAGACTNLRTHQQCDCTWDPDAYCRTTAPTSYCGGATRRANGTLFCPNACGNGALDVAGSCTANPGYSEQCDASSASGDTCVAGEVCDPGNCRCRATVCGDRFVEGDEECERGVVDCDPGTTCDRTCHCVPSSTCLNGTLDVGEQCDPSDPTGVGARCADETLECTQACECVTRRSSCGDGVCDSEAGELSSCPEDCPSACGDGLCNVSAGEGRTCPADCRRVQCCYDTGGCPSEERYACPGSCCCCPAGAVCTRSAGTWTCGF